MVIHFPIALFIGAFGVELFGLWRRNRDYQHVAHIMLVVGALGAIVAAFLGWFAGGFYLTDRNPILMTHRWLGTSIAVFGRSEEHTSELQSLMRISYAVFCLQKTNKTQ